MGEWSGDNVKAIGQILRIFRLLSGLNINLNKSVLFGVKVKAKRYFGIKVVDVFDKRLALWKAHTHSTGGHIMLVKAVLECLPSYYFSLYWALVKVIETLEAKKRRFLWGGNEGKSKTCWVGWNGFTSTKEDGELDLCPLKYSNLALLSKWWWCFKVEKDSLWKKVITGIHYTPRSWLVMPRNKSLSGTWDYASNYTPSL